MTAISRIFLLIAICLGLCFAAPVDTYGALSVKDGAIVDKNQNVVQLRGMSLFWDIWGEGSQYYNAATVNTLVDDWKINVIRAAIGAGSVANAKTIIDAAVAKGIYVIVDWHHHDIDADGAKNFFKSISEYVVNKPNVIYEIFNEPVDSLNGTWENIKTFANDVIPVIRKNSPDNLIVVGTPKYSSRIDLAADDPITGDNAKNVAYSFHFYASTHGSSYRNYVNMAYCKNLPIFITEWGTSLASGDGTIDWDAVATWVNFIENRKLSHANWSISSKSESSSTTPSANSASGQYVKGLISKLNQGQSHNDVQNDPYNCPVVNPVPPQEGGGVVVGNARKLEAENYHTLENSSAQKVSSSSASGKMYLGPLETGSKATYLLTAVKDTIVVLMIVANSSGGATIEVNDGSHTTQGTIAANSSGWGTIIQIPVALHPTGQITLSVKSGSLDIDYVEFRTFYRGDSEADPPTIGDFNTWPQVESWDATPIINAKHPALSWQVKAVGKSIIAQGIPANAKVGIYNLNGGLVASALPAEVQAGVYFVKVNNQVKKVIVK